MTERLINCETLDYIPNAVRSTELVSIPVDSLLADKVKSLLTPENVLNTLDFTKPEVITPIKYPRFDDLFKDRDKVQRLQLLPVKTDEEYLRYHQQKKEDLISKILENLGDSPMVFALNAYPYWLPEDLGQYIIWIKSRETTEKEVIEFLTQCMQVLNLNEDEVILFERPSQTLSKLVKGTFKELRHIHFWLKLKGE